jgi:capsular polysaccharide transport system permease protein
VALNRPDVSVQQIELVRLKADVAYGPVGPAKTGWRVAIARYLRRRVLFIVLVAFPTLASAVYFLGFAADRYESQAQFVVRSPATNASNQLSSVVQSQSSSMRSSDDAYIVKDFILSRDAMDYLVSNAGLKQAFERPEADFLWRYPGPLGEDTNERLFRHYLRFVSVDYDQTTGIADLRVQGFRPSDAQGIAQALIARAETLINALNERSAADAVRSALDEVQAAEQRAHRALDALTQFRNREKLIDPTQVSLASLNTIETLSLTMAEANAQLSDIEKATPEGPQVAPMRHKIAALQDQITAERLKLSGGATSLAPQLAEYQGLMLDQTFAEKSFLVALATLEAARVDAQRQRVFLEPVTNANLPDYPVYPRRTLWTFVVFATGLVSWRIVRALVANTRSHAETH